jgi:AhpD family alkylhydroperoxidase
VTQRPNPYTPDFYPLIQPMIDFANKAAETGLEMSLQNLVKIRASQINGCAQCLFMHTGEARKAGETEERIYLLDGWHESPLYTDRERAALAWTDALTLVSETRAPDDAYALLNAEFTKEEQVKLSLLIGTINTFNRLGIGFRVRHPAGARRAAA